MCREELDLKMGLAPARAPLNNGVKVHTNLRVVLLSAGSVRRVSIGQTSGDFLSSYCIVVRIKLIPQVIMAVEVSCSFEAMVEAHASQT